MVKVISQEVFNETVLENRELLDLSLEEAILETVKQFTAQGVDLRNVVKDPFILNEENPVTKLVSKLKSTVDESEISTCVKELKCFCERGIEFKLLCGREHVYSTLIEKLSSDISLNLQEDILNFFTVFMDGYPDILDERGCIIILNMIESSPDIQKLIFKLIHFTCKKHEVNRQMYMENNIISFIKTFLNNRPSNELLCSMLNIIPALTQDDDIRSDFSKRYVHACSLSGDFLKPFCQLLKEKQIEEPSILESLLNALSSIVVNNEHCSMVDSEECLPVVINLIKKYRQNEMMLVKSFTFLMALAGNDDVNDKIMKLEVAQELELATNRYINNKTIVLSALRLTSKLCLRKPNHGQIFFAIDFPVVITQAMKVHKKNGPIQVSGCWCIRNMTCRNHTFRENFLVLGTEEILNQIICDFKQHAQEAKFALIELGCQVTLDEPWVGQGEKLKP